MACCPLLSDHRLCVCLAVEDEAITPTLHEREVDCHPDGGFASCPTYLTFQRAGRRLSEREYLALWSSEPEIEIPLPGCDGDRAIG